MSGIHYVFHSEEENGKQISVEMFANRYDGLHSNVCMIVNGKATQSVECFDISVDDGIEAWKRKLAEMENILVKEQTAPSEYGKLSRTKRLKNGFRDMN